MISNNIDPIIQRVCDKLVARAAVGLKKYGVGLSRKDLTLRQWLVHQQEEMMDAAGYTESLIDLVDRLKAKGVDVDELLKEASVPITEQTR
jgi:ornithine carbamoyltransferase